MHGYTRELRAPPHTQPPPGCTLHTSHTHITIQVRKRQGLCLLRVPRAAGRPLRRRERLGAHFRQGRPQCGALPGLAPHAGGRQNRVQGERKGSGAARACCGACSMQRLLQHTREIVSSLELATQPATVSGRSPTCLCRSRICQRPAAPQSVTVAPGVTPQEVSDVYLDDSFRRNWVSQQVLTPVKPAKPVTAALQSLVEPHFLACIA